MNWSMIASEPTAEPLGRHGAAVANQLSAAKSERHANPKGANPACPNLENII